jgi:hypothetical protein
LAETAIFASNNQVCPLAPLAEELGAERGSVADIFLPEWASKRIPIVSGSILVLGLVLHALAWLRGRWVTAHVDVMSPLGALSQAWTSAEVSLPLAYRRHLPLR